MSSELCTATAPVTALIDRIIAVLEDGPAGVADFPTLPAVVGCTAHVAPANHYLLPVGTKVISGAEPQGITPPMCVVWNHAKAERRHQHFPKLWDIPITVQIKYDRTLTVADLAEKSEQLELLLFTDYDDEDAIERLSLDASHRVRHLYDIDISPFQVGDDAWTIIQVVFTAYVSGLQSA